MATAVGHIDPDNPRPCSQEQHYFSLQHDALASSFPRHNAEGPPFSNTIIRQLVLTSRGAPVRPRINASIARGFFELNGKWTCYRRNYFQLSCSFELEPKKVQGPFYIRQQGQNLGPIQGFSVLIAAKTVDRSHENSQVKGLVQHTPKRSKDSERAPTRQSIRPFQAVPSDAAEARESTCSTPTSITFDRVQFQKATANNGKRRAKQQYFQIVVELFAKLGALGANQDFILIATCESCPLVVRGRSPGHYEDNRQQDKYRFQDERSPNAMVNHNAHYSDLSAIVQEPPISPVSPTEIGRPLLIREGLDANSLCAPVQQSVRSQGLVGVTNDASGLHQRSFQPAPALVIGHDLPTLSAQDDFSQFSTHDHLDLPTNKQSGTFDYEDKAFSDSSVSSVADQFSMLTTDSSATSALDLSSLLDDIVETLLEDNGIRCLCVDSFTELDGPRFERNLRRLLKHFANDLCRKATGNNEIPIAAFFRRNAVHVARLIRDACSGASSASDAPLVDQAPWMVRVQDVTVAPVAQRLLFSDLDELFSEDDEDEGLPDIELEDVNAYDIISLRHFFRVDEAFLDFREALMDFVVPFIARVWQSRCQAPENDIMRFLQHRYEGKHHQNTRPNAATSHWKNWLHSYFPFNKRNLSGFGLSFMQQGLQAFRRRLRPRIRPGYYRVEWVCECGELLWADFDITQPNLWLSELNLTGIQMTNTSAFVKTVPTASSSEGSGLFSSGGSSELSSVSTFNRPTGSSISQNAAIACSTSSGSDTAQYRASSANMSKYLEVCVNIGEHEISLVEISINNNRSPTIRSDGDLFREIRNKYEAARHCLLTHKLRLFKPARVDYVEFCIEDSIVYIRQSPSAFPSQVELDNKRWEFDLPPNRIPTNVFLHYLKSTRSHVRDTWLRRLPKKLRSSIFAKQCEGPYPGQVAGWGIYIIEDPDGITIIWITVGAVVLSLLVALLWALLKKDVQGAFGIGAFMISAQSAITFAFFTYYPTYSTDRF